MATPKLPPQPKSTRNMKDRNRRTPDEMHRRARKKAITKEELRDMAIRFAARTDTTGRFKPKAKLDPSQVEDLRKLKK